MKAHKYIISVVGGTLDKVSGGGTLQTRIYIPEEGVFGYRSPDKIDFFGDASDLMFEAENAVRGLPDGRNTKYIGEIDLPDDLVSAVIKFGKTEARARESLQNSFKQLS